MLTTILSPCSRAQEQKQPGPRAAATEAQAPWSQCCKGEADAVRGREVQLEGSPYSPRPERSLSTNEDSAQPKKQKPKMTKIQFIHRQLLFLTTTSLSFSKTKTNNEISKIIFSSSVFFNFFCKFSSKTFEKTRKRPQKMCYLKSEKQIFGLN